MADQDTAKQAHGESIRAPTEAAEALADSTHFGFHDPGTMIPNPGSGIPDPEVQIPDGTTKSVPDACEPKPCRKCTK